MKLKIKSVSELNQYISKLIDQDRILSNILVRGVISGLSGRENKHLYFNLLDEESEIPCVLYENNRDLLEIELANDIAVVISGKLSVYKKKGKYQLQVNSIAYDEEALYHNEYLRLEKKYASQGYFDKRKLDSLPKIRKIGLVASKVSAAYGDFMKIISTKFPILDIVFIDVHVQGENTKIDIPLAIKKLNSIPDIDLIVITRGGGSTEELFVYNEEAICNEVYASKLPILSAVGHQRDSSLMDRIAEYHVGTPSMAAELICEMHLRDRNNIKQLMLKLETIMSTLIVNEKMSLKNKIVTGMEQLLYEISLRKRDLESRRPELIHQMDTSLEFLKKDVKHSYEMLKSYDIGETLARGYALVMKDGKAVSVEDLRLGDKLDIKLSKAELGVSLDSINLRGEEDGEKNG